jgi:hypothetical protein
MFIFATFQETQKLFIQSWVICQGLQTIWVFSLVNVGLKNEHLDAKYSLKCIKEANMSHTQPFRICVHTCRYE